MVHKTPKELDQLSPAQLKQYYIDEENYVFGVDHKRNRQGEPIEQGLGSPGHPTMQSVRAYEKYGKGEEGYAENLKAMREHLAKYDAEQRGKRGKRGKRAA